MTNRQYSVRTLRRIVKESTDEFKPVVYNDDNKKINREAYKEMEKSTKEYDGGVSKKQRKIKYPYTDNKGMEDLRYENNPSKETLDRFKSQRKGYVDSEAEKLHKNDEYGNADFNDIDGIDDHVKMMKDGNVKGKEMGLTARDVPSKDYKKQNKTVAEEGRIMKLTFKNTKFLTENHMLSRVPDNYKFEGSKFIMKDKANNEFLVEWHVDDDPTVLNNTRINEERNKIKHLFNYKREESNTSNSVRLTEDNKINDMLNKARKLMI